MSARPGARRSKKLTPLVLHTQPRANPKLTPLEFLLSIMRDTELPLEQRIKVAAMVLPYCHPRMYDNRIGKKEVARAAAEQMAAAGEWADELGSATRIAN